MNCKSCNIELVKGINWYPSQEKNRKYLCNQCQNKISKTDNHRKADALSKRDQTRGIREQCISLLGDKCIRCGFTDVRVLCIDHINGGGRKERGSISPKNYYLKVLEAVTSGSKDYQCLCANCNMIKAREAGEYANKKYKE